MLKIYVNYYIVSHTSSFVLVPSNCVQYVTPSHPIYDLICWLNVWRITSNVENNSDVNS